MDGWMDDGWMEGRMEGWTDGQKEGWKEGGKGGRIIKAYTVHIIVVPCIHKITFNIFHDEVTA